MEGKLYSCSERLARVHHQEGQRGKGVSHGISLVCLGIGGALPSVLEYAQSELPETRSEWSRLGMGETIH